MSAAYCVKEQKACVHWVEKYFKDCLCNLRDELSFTFGFISMVCWGVAELPQIITNFRTKSNHGISLAFLFTWVAGDIFNLVGCLLEPATLPTQFYTAILYTTSTVVLVLQGIFYDHIYRWWKCRQSKVNQQDEDDQKKPLNAKSAELDILMPGTSPPRREFYYTSARSLASSATPPFQTYLRAARSDPSDMELNNEWSSDDEEPPISVSAKSVSQAAPISTKPLSQPRPIPRPTGYGTFLAASLHLPRQSKGMTEQYIGFASTRRLHEGGMEHSASGQWLGWLMAAIYMSGRIPQIWLNLKRGSVEGLNPLMFVFALVANLTYVLSILVRTTEWDKIKANMPWLLDAGVCVALDLFIILQYIYYRYISIRKKKTSRRGELNRDYIDVSKAGVH